MNKKNLYTPYTSLYVALASIFGLSTIILFIILCCNLTNSSVVSVTSALISVLGGLLASVLVAWIIDVAKCKKDNREIVERETQIINNVDMWVDDLFQSFADSCCDKKESDNCESWSYWFDVLIKYDFHKSSDDFYRRMNGTYVSLNLLIHEIDLLNNGLLKEYQTINDGYILNELTILSDACKKIQRVIFENKYENTEHIKQMINDVMLTVVRFWKLNEKKYSHTKAKEDNQ